MIFIKKLPLNEPAINLQFQRTKSKKDQDFKLSTLHITEIVSITLILLKTANVPTIDYENWCSFHFFIWKDNEENEGDMAARIHGTEHPWFWRIHITALVSLGEWKIKEL